MAMLHLFDQLHEELGVQLAVAHLHHGLRGEEADQDARFVEEECGKRDIRFRLFKFDIGKFAKQERLSVEDAARRIRRHFFTRLAKTERFDSVAMAHTADDQIETVFHHFVRGAGGSGLSGILPKNGLFIHPLLLFTKKELMLFLSDEKVDYRIDRTNEDDRFVRNRIRHNFLPLLTRTLNPNLGGNLLRQSEIFRDEEEWLEKLVAPMVSERFEALGRDLFLFRISGEEKLPPALERRLVRAFIMRAFGTTRGFGFAAAERIRELIRGEKGKRYVFSGWVAERAAEGIMLAREIQLKEEVPVRIPGETPIELLDITIRTEVLEGELNRKSSLLEAFLDCAKVVFPVGVRGWRPGDAFLVPGLGKRKKLHDYFIDRKIPRIMRSRIPILVSENRILWVGGHDIDDRVKVTESTKKILRVKVSG